MSPPTNPPAFPSSREPGPEGMTLRDYFAAKAMQSLLHAYWRSEESADALAREFRGKTDTEMISRAAYLYADTMLKHREENP